MKKQEIVLASASPRRRELLAELGVTFTVQPANIHEKPWPGEKPASYALRNAHEKARAVRGSVVVAADTIVVLDGKIMEKPGDAEGAKDMLRALSGREHEVITGLCVRRAGVERAEAVRTTVVFRAMTEKEIADYVASGEPMDKAGAYAIQGGAAGFVKEIRGSFSNVVGLPVERLRAMLNGL
jgi:septum formation protein